MKRFDIEEARAGKPVQTRDGLVVEILCYDLRTEYNNTRPILARIKDNHGYDRLECYTVHGTLGDYDKDWIINAHLYMAEVSQ